MNTTAEQSTRAGAARNTEDDTTQAGTGSGRAPLRAAARPTVRRHPCLQVYNRQHAPALRAVYARHRVQRAQAQPRRQQHDAHDPCAGVGSCLASCGTRQGRAGLGVSAGDGTRAGSQFLKAEHLQHPWQQCGGTTAATAAAGAAMAAASRRPQLPPPAGNTSTWLTLVRRCSQPAIERHHEEHEEGQRHQGHSGVAPPLLAVVALRLALGARRRCSAPALEAQPFRSFLPGRHHHARHDGSRLRVGQKHDAVVVVVDLRGQGRARSGTQRVGVRSRRAAERGSTAGPAPWPALPRPSTPRAPAAALRAGARAAAAAGLAAPAGSGTLGRTARIACRAWCPPSAAGRRGAPTQRCRCSCRAGPACWGPPHPPGRCGRARTAERPQLLAAAAPQEPGRRRRRRCCCCCPCCPSGAGWAPGLQRKLLAGAGSPPWAPPWGEVSVAGSPRAGFELGVCGRLGRARSVPGRRRGPQGRGVVRAFGTHGKSQALTGSEVEG